MLVTKTETAINDISMCQLGEIVVEMTTTGTTSVLIGNSAGEGCRIVNIGDSSAHFTSNATSSDNLGLKLNYSGSGTQMMFISEGHFYFFAGKKYSLTRFALSSNQNGKIREYEFKCLNSLKVLGLQNVLNISGKNIDFSEIDTSVLVNINLTSPQKVATAKVSLKDFKNIDNMTEMRISSFGGSLTGNISEFKNNESMTYIDLSFSGIEGDVINLGKMTKVSNIIMTNCKNVFGSVESLLSKLSENGISVGTSITLGFASTSVTYEGDTINRNLIATRSSSGWNVV